MSHQGNFDSIVNRIFDLLAVNDVNSLPIHLAFRTGAMHSYSSFGLLPALEHIQVLHDLSQKYQIDKKSIVAYGNCYGGYIASLLGKLAPFTFSLVVDNSGYCRVDLCEVLGAFEGRNGYGIIREVDGKRFVIPVVPNTIWSLDETNEYYFSDAHRQIRSMLPQHHRVASPTVYCYYHSVNDGLVPIDQKDKTCSILKNYNQVHYQRITEKEVDGKLFGDVSHGMGASMKEMFDLSMEKYRQSTSAKEDDVDFDRDVTYGFPCSDKLYKFVYTHEGLEVKIEALYL
jgi:hypothetical protein